MLKQRNKTSLRPVILNNVGRYLVLFVFVFASCRTLDYPPKAYVRYELENATLLLEKNDLLKVLNANGGGYFYKQSKRILSDYTCLSMPIVLQHDSLYSVYIDGTTFELLGDINTNLYDLFIKRKPIVYDKRRNVFDKKYYFKEVEGYFCVFFEDGQLFFRTNFPMENDIASVN